jgi:hypothetical protein
MISTLFFKMADPQFIAALLAAGAAAATVYTLAMPLFEGETLNKRMKAVGPSASASGLGSGSASTRRRRSHCGRPPRPT